MYRIVPAVVFRWPLLHAEGAESNQYFWTDELCDAHTNLLSQNSFSESCPPMTRSLWRFANALSFINAFLQRRKSSGARPEDCGVTEVRLEVEPSRLGREAKAGVLAYDFWWRISDFDGEGDVVALAFSTSRLRFRPTTDVRSRLNLSLSCNGSSEMNIKLCPCSSFLRESFNLT